MLFVNFLRYMMIDFPLMGVISSYRCSLTVVSPVLVNLLWNLTFLFIRNLKLTQREGILYLRCLA
jgi:hypothetical protein